MKFNLKIVFTGVCSLVTDKPLGQEPSVLHLVLLDTWKDGEAVDERPIKRHGAMIQFPLRNVTSAAPWDALGVWYPERQRLTFRLDPPDAGSAFYEDGVAGKVADIAKIIPELAFIGKDLVHAANPPVRVVANATFTRGQLTAEREFVNDWRFANTLALVKGMAFKIVLEITGLTKLTLMAEPFTDHPTSNDNPGSGGPQSLEIVGRSEGEVVTITVAHLCDENPLIWPIRKDAPPPPEDRDFKWHYEILSDSKKQELREKLQGQEAPFPIFIPAGPLGRGRNCFPAFWVVEP